MPAREQSSGAVYGEAGFRRMETQTGLLYSVTRASAGAEAECIRKVMKDPIRMETAGERGFLFFADVFSVCGVGPGA